MNDIEIIIKNYLERFYNEKKDLLDFIEFLEKNNNYFNRKNFNGHIVANSLIINEKNEVLSIFHNKLQMYIQPGGHIEENDNSIINATKRELEEETGIFDYELHNWHSENNLPIFIETHIIPENSKKNELKHPHFDFMYIFKANNKEIKLQIEEVSDYKWTPVNKILEESPNSFIAKSLKKMQDLNLI